MNKHKKNFQKKTEKLKLFHFSQKNKLLKTTDPKHTRFEQENQIKKENLVSSQVNRSKK